VRIAEASTCCGLSIETIRYYEKSGILPNISRGPDGHRKFSTENVDWLVLLGSLRETGMAMKTMSVFAAHYRAGDHTIPDRKKILLEHSANLLRRRAALNRCEELLAYKISIYERRKVNGAKQ
jgi:MerR family transcriptional regulator, aldehyde-responsive regulator